MSSLGLQTQAACRPRPLNAVFGQYMNPQILVDMDGVCTDFHTAGISVNEGDPSEVYRDWERNYRGVFFIYDVMGIEKDEFWGAVAAAGERFWVDLKEYEWFAEMLKSLQAIGDVTFLSSGTYSPWSLSGKLKWLQTRFGTAFQDYIFTASKHLLANSHSILIDDYEENVTGFQRHGGKAVLFPQIWNRNHGIAEKLEYTMEAVGIYAADARDTEPDTPENAD